MNSLIPLSVLMALSPSEAKNYKFPSLLEYSLRYVKGNNISQDKHLQTLKDAIEPDIPNNTVGE
jgi:hypothetical protein